MPHPARRLLVLLILAASLPACSVFFAEEPPRASGGTGEDDVIGEDGSGGGPGDAEGDVDRAGDAALEEVGDGEDGDGGVEPEDVALDTGEDARQDADDVGGPDVEADDVGADDVASDAPPDADPGPLAACGTPNWSRTFDGHFVTVDTEEGAIVMAGRAGQSTVVVGMDVCGQETWRLALPDMDAAYDVELRRDAVRVFGPVGGYARGAFFNVPLVDGRGMEILSRGAFTESVRRGATANDDRVWGTWTAVVRDASDAVRTWARVQVLAPTGELVCDVLGEGGIEGEADDLVAMPDGRMILVGRQGFAATAWSFDGACAASCSCQPQTVITYKPESDGLWTFSSVMERSGGLFMAGYLYNPAGSDYRGFAAKFGADMQLVADHRRLSRGLTVLVPTDTGAVAAGIVSDPLLAHRSPEAFLLGPSMELRQQVPLTALGAFSGAAHLGGAVMVFDGDDGSTTVRRVTDVW